ncbi:hypothetical protein Q7P37_007839 [Cladosporium fusiforme]
MQQSDWTVVAISKTPGQGDTTENPACSESYTLQVHQSPSHADRSAAVFCEAGGDHHPEHACLSTRVGANQTLPTLPLCHSIPSALVTRTSRSSDLLVLCTKHAQRRSASKGNQELCRLQAKKARSRTCVAQGPASPSLASPPPASRNRIRSLEKEVSALWSVVRRLEANTGVGNPNSSAHPYETPGSAPLANDSPALDGTPRRVRNELRPASSAAAHEQEREDRVSVETTDSESESLELSPTNHPTHLRQLFDNSVLNSREPGKSSCRHRDSTPIAEARRQLQPLIPSRDDVATITGFSVPWMHIYLALCPRVRTLTNPEETVAHYDEICAPDADPMFIANVLISLAITIRQIPEGDVKSLVPGIRDPSRFIEQVSESVDRTIIGNDVLAGTLEGIETSLFFSRLVLACVDLRKMWIRVRRIICFAELLGLPAQASKSSNGDATEEQIIAASVWDSICVIDRLISTMSNLPAATKSYSIQHQSLISADGKVSVQSYMSRLTDLVLLVQDLDNEAASDKPSSEQLSRVFAVDERFRELAEMTPAAWWHVSGDQMTAERLVQYWHHYFSVRAHIRLAMADDATGRFRLSYNTCVRASQNMALRYIDLRPLVPSGFFASRVLDLQILTAAVFLLLDSSKPVIPHAQVLQQANASGDLVNQLITSLETASHTPGGNFAEKAVVALRSLRTLMQAPLDGDTRQEMTLKLPLIGKIAVTRKLPTSQPEQVHATQSITGWHQSAPEGLAYVPQAGPINDDLPVPFWSMDVLDDFPFLPDVLSDADFNFPDYELPVGTALYE